MRSRSARSTGSVACDEQYMIRDLERTERKSSIGALRSKFRRCATAEDCDCCIALVGPLVRAETISPRCPCQGSCPRHRAPAPSNDNCDARLAVDMGPYK